jgi:hypothetical protein
VIDATYGAGGLREGLHDAPASAIFINNMYGNYADTAPVITGNTLSAAPYSFYINARKLSLSAVKVNAVFLDNQFSTDNTTWALSTSSDPNSEYKQLFNALVGNIGGTGFGYIGATSIANIATSSTTTCNFEHYEIENKALKAVSYYGHTANTNPSDEFNIGTTDFSYGRKLANGDADGTFHFTYNYADDATNNAFDAAPAAPAAGSY